MEGTLLTLALLAYPAMGLMGEGQLEGRGVPALRSAQPTEHPRRRRRGIGP
jgi:hypothetical protein